MAHAALLAWPLIALVIYARLGVARGLIWSVVVGYLFLPEAFSIDLPGLPPYEKYDAIALGALLGTFFFRERNAQPVQIASPSFALLVAILFALLLISPFGTLVTNTETLVTGDVVRPAMSLSDTRAILLGLIALFVPFALAYWHLRTRKLQQELLYALVVMGVIYSFFVLVELRLSPQINIWTYGYFQHSWLQHERGGSHRPIVYLRHGLWLAFLLLTVIMAALTLSNGKPEHRSRYLLIALWMLILLVLGRSLGATLLGLMMTPLLLFLSSRTNVYISAGIAACFLLYPILLTAGLSPAGRVLEWSTAFAPERALSFSFRLINEERLLERAMDKPVFGWGGWARSRIFNEDGFDISVADGIWIVVLGERGWSGYIAQFGLLSVAIFFLALRGRKNALTPEIAGISLIMAANFLYMVPNSTLSPIGMMMSGVLAASVRWGPATDSDAEAFENPDSERNMPRYSRFSAQKKRTAAQPAGPVTRRATTHHNPGRYKRF